MQVLDSSQIEAQDPEVFAAIRGEERRQNDNLELIASENYASAAVREAMACVMTNKYAEGYPGRALLRRLRMRRRRRDARDRPRSSSSSAPNTPTCSRTPARRRTWPSSWRVLQPGDTVLGMSLAHGGHLTHGTKVSFSGKLYNAVAYGVRKDTELIDFDEVRALAREHKPKLIIAGASAYPRTMEYAPFREIADEVGAVVHGGHGAHRRPRRGRACIRRPCRSPTSSPRPRTRRCAARAAASCSAPSSTRRPLDKSVFPGIQGGPFMHAIAAKAVAFGEALQPSFKTYQQQ